MLESKKYIHYGHSSFDRNLFVPIHNRERWVKPSGGLWASAVDSDYGWFDWCRESKFNTDRLQESFTFTLSEKARVLHIYNVAQLDDLPQIDRSDIWCLLDFEQLLADGVDAVELHMSGETSSIDNYILGRGLYWKLYGWDCDSILIMNPDVVEVV